MEVVKGGGGGRSCGSHSLLCVLRGQMGGREGAWGGREGAWRGWRLLREVVMGGCVDLSLYLSLTGKRCA